MTAPPKVEDEGLLTLDVHAVERVATEGRELEVDDFLADRLQLHRVSHVNHGACSLKIT